MVSVELEVFSFEFNDDGTDLFADPSRRFSLTTFNYQLNTHHFVLPTQNCRQQ